MFLIAALISTAGNVFLLQLFQIRIFHFSSYLTSVHLHNGSWQGFDYLPHDHAAHEEGELDGLSFLNYFVPFRHSNSVKIICVCVLCVNFISRST